MNADRDATQEPAATDVPVEDYVAPTLTDLGRFQELTKNQNDGVSLDAEGFSV